uniref:Potassium transporter Trk n=1 Tax=Neobacillus citreus TaxID=2833578 RepID=A0A942Y9J5_9BACI
MSTPDGPEERPAPNAVSTSDEVTIRRAPKFGVFIVGGALLGFLATLVVVSLTMNLDRGDQQETQSFGSLVGYFSLWGVTIGAAVGAVVAVVLDRVFQRRAARLTAERVEVEMPADTVEGELEDHGDDPAGR